MSDMEKAFQILELLGLRVEVAMDEIEDAFVEKCDDGWRIDGDSWTDGLRDRSMPLCEAILTLAQRREEWTGHMVYVEERVRTELNGDLEPGRYRVRMPGDYDPEVVTGEDILCDPEIVVIWGPR